MMKSEYIGIKYMSVLHNSHFFVVSHNVDIACLSCKLNVHCCL